MKDKNKATVIELTDAIIKDIKTPDFQRNLRSDRIPEIQKSVTTGAMIPPVVLGKVDGVLYVIDGQHRLEARRKMEFPLSAVVYDMTRDEAAKNFVTLNTTASRVSLKHRLQVDPGDDAKKIRSIALRMNIPLQKVYNILIGMSRRHNDILKTDVPSKNMELCEKILRFWTNDPRWGNKKFIYDHPGVLKLVGRLYLTAKNPDKMLGLMSKLDYSIEGPLARRYGTSWTQQTIMKNYVMEYLFKEGQLK